ncbi:MAG: RNA methyltransferase [Crocinitomix sp.]|nr:RNA methyltransferase [Crocinitomix sp.]
MAFDEYQTERVTQILEAKKANFFTKKMIGGLCFMVNDKMLCGMHIDKKTQSNLLMARIGEEASLAAFEMEGVLPMDFTGRPMKGYIFVTPEAYDRAEDLEFWIQKCLDFNPLAKASKKKAKKKT